MELDKIISVLEEKEVGSDVIAAIKGLDNSADVEKLQKELESERGKHAGILEDKKKFKERAESAETKLKEIEKAGMSVEEQTKAKIEEMEQKLAEATAAREKQESDFKAQQRDAALSDITSSVRWAKGVPIDTAKLIVKNSFSAVEDFTDKKSVESKLKELTEAHKSFIDADAPSGSGGRSGGSDSLTGGDGKAATMEELMAETWS